MDKVHPSIAKVVARIEADQIGGAADMAKEAAQAISVAMNESKAKSLKQLNDECSHIFDLFIQSSPSVMPVTQVLHRVGAELETMDVNGSVESSRQRLSRAADEALAWITDAVKRVAAIGADMIANGDVVFTYSMSSTVYGMMRAAAGAGKRFKVVTTESRPGNEGLHTISELADLNIQVTIGIDASIGQLLRKCTSVYVGGDTVTATGAALCKIGSFPTALMARYYGIPFRVAADTSKFDPSTIQGMPLWIREMPTSDILTGEIPSHSRVVNPVFEIVPWPLIDCIVTEVGVVAPGAVLGLMAQVPHSGVVARRVAEQHRKQSSPGVVSGVTDERNR
jgi:ribose 1,5-bisphosphate isomerase